MKNFLMIIILHELQVYRRGLIGFRLPTTQNVLNCEYGGILFHFRCLAVGSRHACIKIVGDNSAGWIVACKSQVSFLSWNINPFDVFTAA